MRLQVALLLLLALPARASVVELPPGKRVRIKHASWVDGGKGLLVVTDSVAWLWDGAGKAKRFEGDWQFSYGFSASRDGKRLAAVRDRSIIQIWDFAAGKERTPIGGKVLKARRVALDASGRYFAYATEEGVHLHDLDSGSALETDFIRKERVEGVRLAGPYRLVMADSYGKVTIRDLGKKKPLREAKGGFSADIVMSPSESHAAVSSVDAAGGRGGPRLYKVDAWRLSDGSGAGGWTVQDSVHPVAVADDGAGVLAYGSPRLGAKEGLYRYAPGKNQPKLLCAMEKGAVSVSAAGARPDQGMVLVWENQGHFDLPERLSFYDVDGCAVRGRLEVGKESWVVSDLEGRWDGLGAGGAELRKRSGMMTEFFAGEDP